MRFETWAGVTVLGIAALGSGGVLAAGIAEPTPVANVAQVLSIRHTQVKRVGKDPRADAGQKTEAAPAQAMTVPPVAPAVPEAASVQTAPSPKDETHPSDVRPVALKRVRG